MEDDEKQDGNNSDNSKIECKSKRSINTLLQKLKDSFVAFDSQPSETAKIDLESINRKIYQVEVSIPHPLFHISKHYVQCLMSLNVKDFSSLLNVYPKLSNTPTSLI